MLSIGILAPTKYLEDFSSYNKNNFHIVSANRFINDLEYSQFYRANYKKYKILLNDIQPDQNGDINFYGLADIINDIHPIRITLPSVDKDAEKSIEVAFKFLEFFRGLQDHGIEFIAKIQGKNIEEWNLCLKIFINTSEISILGIDEIYPIRETNELTISKLETISHILRNIPEAKQKKFHFIRSGKDFFEVLKSAKDFPNLISVETSLPYELGCSSIKMDIDSNYNDLNPYNFEVLNLNETKKATVLENLKLVFATLEEISHVND